MQPHFGNKVKPAIVTAHGTSSLHGRAAEVTQQQHCAWAIMQVHPSQSMVGPQQQQGRHGAPGCN
ncbi:hypothetical protein ACHAWU_002934 [Discostella pseudostelligera]|uniref:Uncharacterized protein n=1 Tax=Discostella pseudostelligera TaxID=259834 RepID=A0ABD3M986_9STRA